MPPLSLEPSDYSGTILQPQGFAIWQDKDGQYYLDFYDKLYPSQPGKTQGQVGARIKIGSYENLKETLSQLQAFVWEVDHPE